MKLPVVLLLLVFTVGSCAERKDRLLLGDWQAVSITEAGDSLRLDPAEVGFSFRSDNRYTFRSTLRYTEAGTWRFAEGFLFALDTTRAASQERVVAVGTLNRDSLGMRMLNDGVERQLIFLRTSPFVE